MVDNGRLTLVVVWLALFCDYLLLTIVIPIFPDLGASTFATSALFATKAAVQVLASPVVGLFVDKYGMWLLMIGLLVESGSTIVFAFTYDYGYWMAARGCQGIGSALIMSSAFLKVQQLHPDDDAALGISMGLVTTGIITGVTLGPPIGGILFDIEHWIPFIFCSSLIGAVFVLSCILHFRTSGDDKTDSSSRSLQAQMEHSTSSTCATDHTDGSSSLTDGVEEKSYSNSNIEEKTYMQKVCGLLCDKHITVTLGMLFSANAAISCLESTLGKFLEDEMNMSATQVGLVYISTSVPSVVCAKLAGSLGNRYGRWKIVLIGMCLQGAFFTIGPKDLLWVEFVSLFGLGMGMGLVDGCAPAMLAQVNNMSHGGTGVVYSLQTAAIQLGFLFGPLVGSAIYELTSFQEMSILLGGFMVLVSPLMLINSGLPSVYVEVPNNEEVGLGDMAVLSAKHDGCDEGGRLMENEKGEAAYGTVQ